MPHGAPIKLADTRAINKEDIRAMEDKISKSIDNVTTAQAMAAVSPAVGRLTNALPEDSNGTFGCDGDAARAGDSAGSRRHLSSFTHTSSPFYHVPSLVAVIACSTQIHGPSTKSIGFHSSTVGSR